MDPHLDATCMVLDFARGVAGQAAGGVPGPDLGLPIWRMGGGG